MTSLLQPPFCPCLLKAIQLQSDFQWKFSFPFSSVRAGGGCTRCLILVCPHTELLSNKPVGETNPKKGITENNSNPIDSKFSFAILQLRRKYILEQLFSYIIGSTTHETLLLLTVLSLPHSLCWVMFNISLRDL